MTGVSGNEGRDRKTRKGFWLVSAIRQAGGYTQEALARELGVSFATVNSWERGRSRPRRAHILALESLAHSLGIRTDISVLIIDDDPTACEIIEGLVKGSPPHAEVYTATDPSQGLLLCGAVDPDILLLDIMMPEINGFELARRLGDLDLNHTSQIVFVTASTDLAIDTEAARFGHRVLRKPIAQEAIDELLLRAGAIKEGAIKEVAV
ncbi:MAG: response regulator [Acidimicrobiia bacterium]